MTFKKTKDLELATFETNLYLTGLVSIKEMEVGRYVIQCENKCFELTKDYISEDNDLQREFCSNEVSHILGKVIAFEIPEHKTKSFYFCVTTKEGRPVFIFRRNKIKNLFCFKPKLTDCRSSIIYGEVGEVTKLVYNIVKNKALNIIKPLPRTNYKKKIDELLSIIKDTTLPERYNYEENYILSNNISYAEYNKYYLTSNLKYIKENYNKPQICYSGILDELEEKILTAIKYYDEKKIIS